MTTSNAGILNSLASRKGWLHRREGMFQLRSRRYWAILYCGQLYLYTGQQDTAASEVWQLRDRAQAASREGARFKLTGNSQK